MDDILDELCGACGVNEPSKTPFFSPALLVKKKDVTWRFYVDYMGLNDITIKNKYTIPIVDDLLDELCGAIIFSMVNLRADYHHIMLKREDMFKTTLRTLAGHYVMSSQEEAHNTQVRIQGKLELNLDRLGALKKVFLVKIAFF